MSDRGERPAGCVRANCDGLHLHVVRATGRPSCTAHRKAARGGGHCSAAPPPGQTVCHWHGGQAPQALAGAVRRRQAAEIVEAVNRYALEVVTTPEQTLQRALYRARGAVDCLFEIVGKLPMDEVIRSEARKLLDERTKYATDLAAEMSRLGIEEKHVQIEQAQALSIVALLRRVVDALDLTPELRRQADAVVLRELQTIDGGAA